MIEETPYDLRWRMFGIHVRVHPLFWLVAGLLSWDFVRLGLLNIVIGIVCIFLSILIHELGHVVVGKCFGSHGHIVLWACGGLAIGSNANDKRWQRILVSAAGPLAQFIVFGVLLLILPHMPQTDMFVGRPLLRWFILGDEVYFFNDFLWTFLFQMLLINLYWPVLNLLPIWPLDGGQISRELFTWGSPRNGVRLSLQLSMGVAALLALHAVIAQIRGGGIPYLPSTIQEAVFFGFFVAISYQALQMEHQHDNWLDDHRWN
jgi:Zn-dependent protease